MSPNETISLEGYTTYRSDRPKSKNERHYGGLAVLIKNELNDLLDIKITHQTHDYMWLRISKNKLESNEDMYICIAYIPPSNSEYLAKVGVDVFDQIQNDIVKFSQLGQIILTGDLNARTGNQQDFITNDGVNQMKLDFDYKSDKQISLRNSLDTIKNERGNDLIDLCVSSRMRILNGRTIGDTFGYFTCHKWNGSSVVDYAIVSENLLDYVSYFKVNQTLGDMSDHCCISFKIQASFSNLNLIASSINEEIVSYPIKFKWHENAIPMLQSAMTSQVLQDEIKNFCERQFDLTEQSIDEATEAIGQIYKIAAEKSLKPRATCNQKKNNKQKNKKPWYDKSLVRLKRSVQNCGKKLLKQPNNADYRRNYFMLLKIYRKSCKNQERKYRQQIINQLDELNESHPKAYWEIVKKLKESKPSKNGGISPKEWYEHFKNLANKENFKKPTVLDDGNVEQLLRNNDKSFSELDFKIKESEVSKAINKLKNNKATGPDGLCNEIIKYSQHVMLPLITKLFNQILLSGIYPTDWAEGVLKTLHKKDDPSNTNNYRGITITNVMGKLFNSVMNNRVVSFLKKHNKLNKEQIGFKEGHRTSDHIFVIKTLIQKYKKEKKQIYACFVDLKKAFDSVSIPCLLYKLQKIGINGYMYNVIKSMYSKVKLRVDVNIGLTKDFTSNIGVRQGDNMSPTLFNIFLNDMPNIFSANECTPVSLMDMQLNCLLYADDLVLLSESREGLQNSIDNLGSYCDKWGLTINTLKTKTIIFNTNKLNEVPFTLNSENLENVHEISYLGVILNHKGSFESTKSVLYKKGLKALFKLKYVLSPLPKLSTCLHLFDHLVKPIMLYCSEVWSYSLFGEKNCTKISKDNLESLYSTRTAPIERAFIKFCKMLLHLPSKSSNSVLYGEIGAYPLYLDCISRMLKYWSFIENKSSNLVLKAALDCSKEMHFKGTYTWFSFVKNIQAILGNCHNPNNAPNLKHIKVMVKKLRYRYQKHWHSILNDSDTKQCKSKKLRTYRLFKTSFGRERYLSVVKNIEVRSCLSKFRLSAHNLMIEKGRHYNMKVDDRICKFCSLNAIEDEKHFVMHCHLYEGLRHKLMDTILTLCPHFNQLSSVDQFCWIMGNNIDSIIHAVAEFIHKAMHLRKSKS